MFHSYHPSHDGESEKIERWTVWLVIIAWKRDGPSAAESKHPVSPMQRSRKIATIAAALWSFVRTASREVEIGSTIKPNGTDVEGKRRNDFWMRLLLQLQGGRTEPVKDRGS